MSIKVEYTFRDSEVVCAMTRDIRTTCTHNKALSEVCVECLRRNGVAKERTFDSKTNATVKETKCQLDHAKKLIPIKRGSEKIGRNERCTCKSGKKYKHCCGR